MDFSVNRTTHYQYWYTLIVNIYCKPKAQCKKWSANITHPFSILGDEHKKQYVYRPH